MKTLYTIVVMGQILIACNSPRDMQPDPIQQESSLASPRGPTTPPESDTLFISERSVIFFTPNTHDLQSLTPDQGTQEGIRQAVGDFAYYASIIADSLEGSNIDVVFTEKKYISMPHQPHPLLIDRQQSGSLIGLAMYDPSGSPKVLYGMQTHLTLWASINKYFAMTEHPQVPLLDYFQEIDPQSFHIYSSHSDILNQTGKRVDPSYYQVFGSRLAKRASQYRMSLFAYYKFTLNDSLIAAVCRVPSRYDESAINLYIWDPKKQRVTASLELAENIWNEHWIMVKDSWITTDSSTGTFEVIQRKKEASTEQGQRQMTDSLYRWQWNGREFLPMPLRNLSKSRFPLKDWASYEEPQPAPKITELTIIDEDFVWLPLETGDLTWENLILELPKPYSFAKEPIPNQFRRQQIDTLVTVSQSKWEFKFYNTPDNYLFLGGQLSDGAVIFKNGMQIGIPKSAFSALFEQLSARGELPDLIRISSKDGDRIFSCQFSNDTLIQIELANYIH